MVVLHTGGTFVTVVSGVMVRWPTWNSDLLGLAVERWECRGGGPEHGRYGRLSIWSSTKLVREQWIQTNQVRHGDRLHSFLDVGVDKLGVET